ncbi:HNH endonuclease [Streptomyces violaceusniger]|uniref:HNH endonuclease n=1 Tax=Streptomyces violaceusniger TaxID=68280 RepID=UPI000996434C|nr:HNH endonuclease signature motif containing protein [Streptomyces hygroscopicus]AQW55281.1 hypothetical protein SHXM_08744 [Streptomyces hygroscopicus]
MSGGWTGSTRRYELPPNWATEIRPAILLRDQYRCQWFEHGTRCAKPATDVDHIGDRNDHRHENLQALCRECHARKTSRQGNAARWAVRRQRPPERHPGWL